MPESFGKSTVRIEVWFAMGLTDAVRFFRAPDLAAAFLHPPKLSALQCSRFQKERKGISWINDRRLMALPSSAMPLVIERNQGGADQT